MPAQPTVPGACPDVVAAAPDRLPNPRPEDVSGGRWAALDAFRGVALFAMVAHHLAAWTGGRVRERWIGYPDFAVTDLAAPMFAVGLGAAAFLVGRGIATADDPATAARKAALKWGKVLSLAVVLDVALGDGIEGGGILYTLFALGVATIVLVAVGLRSRWVWWAVAVVSASIAGPVLLHAGTADNPLEHLWVGAFPLSTYLAFTATGTALAAGAGSGGERSLPLWRAAVAALVLGLAIDAAIPAAAPDGLWPPSRHPGDLAFTMWGVAASLVIWATLRACVRPTGAVAAALARAGRRTLLVFGLHYCIKLVLQHFDRVGTYDTRAWGLATWALTIAICAVATVPGRKASDPGTTTSGTISSRDGITQRRAVPVVRSSPRPPARSRP